MDDLPCLLVRADLFKIELIERGFAQQSEMKSLISNRGCWSGFLSISAKEIKQPL